MSEFTLAIGKHIARRVFSMGDRNGDKCQRLEFKGGNWPDNETSLGGICESSLASHIASILSEFTRE